jgi:alkylation response protein AidB-like acyl-CoA dehydrogenase
MSEDTFRLEVRRFIQEHLPAEMAERTLRGYHPYKPDVVWWTRQLCERGWSVPNWPVEYGGPGWTVAERHVFDEECYLAGCPALSPQGVYLVGPTIYTFGNEAQKRFFLPPIRTAEHLWAQGFSEPNAGSDLAALQTRAVREGSHYIVNGQKIWTSDAHHSEWLFLLVRTSTVGRPQAGISFLLADLATPGITVRPIRSIDGGHILNEVFLQDVRVPVENLIGEENQGWTYAKDLLGKERTFSAEAPRCKGLLARLKRIAAAVPAGAGALIDDPQFSRRMAQLEIDVIAHEMTLHRAVLEEEGGKPGDVATASILKIRGTELVQRIGALTVEALGDEALPRYLESDHLLASPRDAVQALALGVVADFLYRRAATIYGGTNEVQRNIIAAQLLKGA